MRAARHGGSIEDETRDNLASAVKRQGRVKLGSLLAAIGREVKLTDVAFVALERARQSEGRSSEPRVLLLDTNVFRESLSRAPEARVIEWIDVQALGKLSLSAMTLAELRAGVVLLPTGKRPGENATSIVREHLRHIRTRVGQIADDVVDVNHRLASLEAAIVLVEREVDEGDATDARQQVVRDRLAERIHRVERPLGLFVEAGRQQLSASRCS